MDRDFLIDLFAGFGPVAIRRMFSGFGISADGTNFLAVLGNDGMFFNDDQTIPRFAREGCKPFQYQTRALEMQKVPVSLNVLLFNTGPEELTDWARAAL